MATTTPNQRVHTASPQSAQLVPVAMLTTARALRERADLLAAQRASRTAKQTIHTELPQADLPAQTQTSPPDIETSPTDISFSPSNIERTAVADPGRLSGRRFTFTSLNDSHELGLIPEDPESIPLRYDRSMHARWIYRKHRNMNFLFTNMAANGLLTPAGQQAYVEGLGKVYPRRRQIKSIYRRLRYVNYTGQEALLEDLMHKLHYLYQRTRSLPAYRQTRLDPTVDFDPDMLDSADEE